jgi:DNA invertase Pin-like site-specific DNA recombinase
MLPHFYTGSVTTCAIWCRVSKTGQETANQLEELRQWAQRKGFEVTREYVFEVSASNGSARHREMLGQALADARLGRFEVMLVWALDRVSREGVEATLAILRRFAGHGTAVWSLKEPWTETADPRMAELLASLYAWMAAEESRRRSERTRAGLERRKREGLPVGRQPGATDKKPRRPVRFSRPAGVLLRFDRAAAGPAILPGRGQGDLQPAAGHVRCSRVCE